MNTTITWRWETQYLLTTTVSPVDGGTINVSPTSPDGWYNAKSTITLTATGNDGNGNVGYDFSYWTGGLRGTVNPQSLLLRGPRTVTANYIPEKRYFTVSLSPPGCSVEPSPPVGTHEFYYGDTVVANTGPTPYPGGTGIQYVCTGHLGTGDVTDGPETGISFIIYHDSSVTWLWKTQYNLTVSSDYDSPTGAGWYDSGTTVSSSVSSPVSGGTGTQYVCTGWSGTGSAPHSGTSTSTGNFIITAASSVTWNWKTQYYLTIDSSHGAPVGAGWYDSGATANWSVTSPVSGGTGIQYVADSASGSELMDAPKTITVSWTTQYYLTVISSYGNPQGAGWYDSGATAHWSVTNPYPGAAGVQYVATPPTSGDVVMDAPKTVTVSWTTQYYLTVVSAYGNPQGEGWYNAGTTAHWSVTSPYPGAAGVQYIATPPTSGDVVMDAPKTVTVAWTTQYYLTVVSAYDNPQGEGWYNAGSIAHWGVTSPWSGGTGIRYVASPTSGDILMDAPKTVTVSWTTQYYLTVVSAYGGNPQGEGWYNAGATAPWSVTSPWSGGTGIRYIASPASGDIVMDAPKTVTVSWITQYYLTVASAYGNPQGEGWYNAGATAPWGVTSPWSGGTGVQYVAIPPTSGDVLMNGPKSVTVTWVAQYYLTVVSAYGNPQGEGWYIAGATAHWSVTSPWSGGTGIRYVASPTSGDILMDAPKTVTVSWTTQYRLTTVANPSAGGSVTPSGETWQNENAVVTLTAVANTGYGFDGWAGDLSGSDNPKDLIMDGPKSVTANFLHADFSGSPRSSAGWAGTNPDFPLTVLFTDESTGNVTSWFWDFDNNGTTDSTLQNPSKTYSSAGRYTVKLTVTGPSGSNTTIKTDYIRACGAANRIYVTTKGKDTWSGSSWSAAKKTIQAGINAASADYAVLVAKGTYSGTGNVNLDFGGKAIHLKGVTAGSGYDVGQDWVIDGGNTAGNQGFYFATGETAHSVVDNFTIQKCNAGADAGGAIYCYGASPTIITCSIGGATTTYGNKGSYGGGIYCETNSNPTITNCTIKSNQATTGDGGGIYCYNNSNPRITDCTIEGNSADKGGGIFCRRSSPIMSNCTIKGNVASDSVGTGGGIYLETDSNATITNCTICGNSALWYGGGIYCESSTPTITKSTIGGALGGNWADDTGGGICFYIASPRVTNCVITNNWAVITGGGIECWNNSSPAIINCLIANNITTSTDTGAGNGGGIDCYDNSDATISNCTIANNSATNDGGGMSFAVCAPVLNNTIVWGNIADSDTSGAGLGNQIYTWRSVTAPCTVTLNYSDYADNTLNSNNIAGSGTVTATNCIVSDPLFVAAGSGNYRLQSVSPCIDIGSNALVPAGVTTDLDGNPRIRNSAVDIGAYEY
jgi:parallel beta-helix repeat protein